MYIQPFFLCIKILFYFIMIKKILIYLIGIFFIISSISKLFPIEPFELQLSNIGFTWKISAIIARLIIIFEFSIGFALLLFKYQKKVLLLMSITLVFFSLSLIYLWITQGAQADCGCLGTWLQMPVIYALGRNLLMLIILIWSMYTTDVEASKPKWLKFQWFLYPGFLLFVVIANPADNWLDYSDGDWAGATLQWESHTNDEKKIIAFLSPSCKHCQLATKKLQIMVNKGLDPHKIHVVFMGEWEQLDFFWNETQSGPFEYSTLPTAEFLRIGGGNLPGIFLLEPNLTIHKRLGYRDLDIEEVLDFMK